MWRLASKTGTERVGSAGARLLHRPRLKHSYVRATAVQVHNMHLRLSGACTGQKSCEAPSAAGCRWSTW